MDLVNGLITCKNKKEAEKIANALLEKKLIACANIVGKIDSVYQWNGKIEKSKEALLLLKTRKNFAKKIISETGKIHSYKVPCIEFIEVSKANKGFQKWVESETAK